MQRIQTESQIPVSPNQLLMKKIEKANESKSEVHAPYVEVNEFTFAYFDVHVE